MGSAFAASHSSMANPRPGFGNKWAVHLPWPFPVAQSEMQICAVNSYSCKGVRRTRNDLLFGLFLIEQMKLNALLQNHCSIWRKRIIEGFSVIYLCVITCCYFQVSLLSVCAGASSHLAHDLLKMRV